MSPEEEGDGGLVRVVQVSDAGSFVLISRSVTPPQSNRPGIDNQTAMFLLYLDLSQT